MKQPPKPHGKTAESLPTGRKGPQLSLDIRGQRPGLGQVGLGGTWRTCCGSLNLHSGARLPFCLVFGHPGFPTFWPRGDVPLTVQALQPRRPLKLAPEGQLWLLWNLARIVKPKSLGIGHADDLRLMISSLIDFFPGSEQGGPGGSPLERSARIFGPNAEDLPVTTSSVEAQSST